MELLKDSFLQNDNSRQYPLGDPLPLDRESLKTVYTPSSGPLSMDIDADYKEVPVSSCGSPTSPVLEYQRRSKNNEFRLRGKKNDDTSVSLTLRIADFSGILIFQFY